MIMRGTTIGASTKARIAPLPRMRLRTSRNAAGVPISIASTPAPHATTNERMIACIQMGESNISRYHCSEKPLGGQVSSGWPRRHRDHQERRNAEEEQHQDQQHAQQARRGVGDSPSRPRQQREQAIGCCPERVEYEVGDCVQRRRRGRCRSRSGKLPVIVDRPSRRS